MKEKNILVIDDDPNMLRSIEFILEAADSRVTTGRNGKEALEKILAGRARQESFDLLITDIQMPGLTGLQLIDELRRREIPLPVLIITAFGDQKLKNELARRGCRHYLDKPFAEDALMKMVSAILQGEK